MPWIDSAVTGINRIGTQSGTGKFIFYAGSTFDPDERLSYSATVEAIDRYIGYCRQQIRMAEDVKGGMLNCGDGI